MFWSYSMSQEQEIPNPSVEGREDMGILISGTAQFIIPSHENFKGLNPEMFETNPKMPVQFDCPFEMEAIRSCKKEVNLMRNLPRWQR